MLTGVGLFCLAKVTDTGEPEVVKSSSRPCCCRKINPKDDSVAYPGFQRVGCLRSGPIQKVGGGGGGLQVRYTKSGGGGGGGGASGRYMKSGGALQVRYTRGGGGPFRFRSDTFGHTENIYMIEYTRRLIINNTKYNFK